MSGINDLWSEHGRRSAIEECAEIATDAFCNGETDQCADRIRQLLPEEL